MCKKFENFLVEHSETKKSLPKNSSILRRHTTRETATLEHRKGVLIHHVPAVFEETFSCLSYGNDDAIVEKYLEWVVFLSYVQ